MQLVSEKRIYLEIATRNLNRIFTLPKRNFFRDTFWNHVKVILSKECSVTAVNYYCTDIKVCKVLCNIYLTGFVETYPRAHNTQLNDKCPWTPSPPRCFGHSITLHPQALSPVAELPQCHSLAVNHARQPAEKISFPGNGINLIPHSKYVSKTLPSPPAVLWTHSSRQPTLRQASTWAASGY